MAAVVIEEILRRNKLKSASAEQVILGNAVLAGLGQNPGRQAAILAGLPVSVPGLTVSNVCGSGLQSVILGVQSILCGEFGIIVAGGSESATQAPYLIRKDVPAKKIPGNLIDSLIFDGLWCPLSGKRMGELSDEMARQFSISRLRQDAYALESHFRALRATAQGRFRKEIVPVSLTKSKVFDKDERPRKDIDLKKLQALKAVFSSNGTATAGSASVPCDGAAMVLLASEEAVRQYKLKPRARILGYASVALEPEMVFAGSVNSILACLQNARLSLRDVDLFEIGEALATQPLFAMEQLKLSDDKINLFGGDIALGHPLGAAGARILVTLLHSLRDQKRKRGVASVCLGGGGSVAMAIEVL